jgi:hypothetical protein
MHRRIGLVERSKEIGDELRPGPIRRNAVVDPVLLAETLEQTGIAQQFQVARYARLALTEDLGELADRELTAGEHGEQTQARGFRGAAQALDQLCRGISHGLRI